MTREQELIQRHLEQFDEACELDMPIEVMEKILYLHALERRQLNIELSAQRLQSAHIIMQHEKTVRVQNQLSLWKERWERMRGWDLLIVTACACALYWYSS